MLPSENRLRRREDFATAVRRGRRAGRPLLVVHLRRDVAAPEVSTGNPHRVGGMTPPARAGFVVSKAVGPAVVRNRVKRRLRHLVRDRLDLLPAGSLVVVRALPPAAGAEYADLARDLDTALRRLLEDPAGPQRKVPASGSASSSTGAGQ
ncbi:ribonuclease P protein component [Phaeacidiphilus oryzae]|uniref:ribonuclease P protein component n=1 Tax=Phaeacidiphilus oryzae TaxID=348818 RepID=UPI000A032865|nr:ribonuclease P protein component [Phaeacidiphilus oryzae]